MNNNINTKMSITKPVAMTSTCKLFNLPKKNQNNNHMNDNYNNNQNNSNQVLTSNVLPCIFVSDSKNINISRNDNQQNISYKAAEIVNTNNDRMEHIVKVEVPNVLTLPLVNNSRSVRCTNISNINTT
jgi:hypothetical protein